MQIARISDDLPPHGGLHSKESQIRFWNHCYPVLSSQKKRVSQEGSWDALLGLLVLCRYKEGLHCAFPNAQVLPDKGVFTTPEQAPSRKIWLSFLF